jgi:hypothetical protein
MERTGNRFAYRCTPLTMANSTGWELLCPSTIEATWNGGAALVDLTVEYDGKVSSETDFAQSHFGNGILSFHPGYLFRTDPEWAVWCRGAPNHPKDGICALDGLIETDWLPFTFTMNWLFTRPGTIRFEKGEPFCFVVPVLHNELEEIRPTILPLSANPELAAETAAWGAARQEFNQRLGAQEPMAIRQRWQRFYLTGKSPRGQLAPDSHRTKRKMSPPVDLSPVADSNGAGVVKAGESRTSPAGKRTAPQSSQHIIWIASYPSSGGLHAEIFLHNLMKELRIDPDAAAQIDPGPEQPGWQISARHFEEILNKPMDEVRHVEIAQTRPKVQQNTANSRAAPFFLQTQLCVANDHRYPTINLDATLAAIYVVRNPLDVAVCRAHHLDATIDATISNMAKPGFRATTADPHLYEVLGSWSQHAGSWIGLASRPVHMLRYEDMMNNPVRVFSALARFLRLPATDAQIQAAIEKTTAANLTGAEYGFEKQPPVLPDGRQAGWRDVLSSTQVQDIARAHAPMMQRFGYLPPDCGVDLRLKEMA